MIEKYMLSDQLLSHCFTADAFCEETDRLERRMKQWRRRMIKQVWVRIKRRKKQDKERTKTKPTSD